MIVYMNSDIVDAPLSRLMFIYIYMYIRTSKWVSPTHFGLAHMGCRSKLVVLVWLISIQVSFRLAQPNPCELRAKTG